MTRRLIGIWVCLPLIVVSTLQLYGRVADKKILFPLEIETSYFSLELLDDFTDAARPAPTISWSAREKVVGKLTFAEKVRRIRLVPPPIILYEQPVQTRPIVHDIFRLQEVFRI